MLDGIEGNASGQIQDNRIYITPALIAAFKACFACLDLGEGLIAITD